MLQFDAVIVINLERRPDRLKSFFSDIDSIDWPFKRPAVFRAVDGEIVPSPINWLHGAGAWGCLQSHRHVLESSLLSGFETVLIFEDDAIFKPNFSNDVGRFLRDVPSDWDGLMFGGQLFEQEQVSPGIIRCLNCQRTQAYALRGKYLHDLYQHWISRDGHCDHLMAEIQHNYRIYAPEPFFVGQRAGQSDISGCVNPPKFWQSPRLGAPCVVLKAPREILHDLRNAGFHTGFSRDPITDYDNGLMRILGQPDLEMLSGIREWLSTIQWECASIENSICTLWHPAANVAVVRAATRCPVFSITASTVEDALLQLAACKSFEEVNRRPIIIVLLRSARNVVEVLRTQGFHSGNWRDPGTDIDMGLLDIFSEENLIVRQDRLARWIADLQREAEEMDEVVTVWHPAATVELLKASCNFKVVEISANDPTEATTKWRRLTQENAGLNSGVS